MTGRGTTRRHNRQGPSSPDNKGVNAVLTAAAFTEHCAGNPATCSGRVTVTHGYCISSLIVFTVAECRAEPSRRQREEWIMDSLMAPQVANV